MVRPERTPTSAPGCGPDDPSRAELRAAEVARIPSWYSPLGHLACPSLIGLGVILACALDLHDFRPWQLVAIPLTFLASNAFEWRAHKYVLHRRLPLFGMLYERHTPLHHRIFVTRDMSIRDRREFRLVLIPAYGILGILASLLPLLALLFALHQRNVALLVCATSMGYVVSYEWLHLAYHMPPESFVGRRALVRRLRRHHATHHDPQLMQKWNMNVTVPLWDWVRGTIYRPGADAQAPAEPSLPLTSR